MKTNSQLSYVTQRRANPARRFHRIGRLLIELAFATWTTTAVRGQESPPISPIARMAFDSVRREAVLFVPSPTNIAISETWVWRGSSWFLKARTNEPPGLNYPTLAFDAARKETVLFGGW